MIPTDASPNELSRRDFIVAAAAAGAGAMLTNPPGLKAEMRPPRQIRKALKYGMIKPGDTIAEKFAAAKAAGFDGVEMDSPNPFETDAVLAAKAEVGIEIPGVVDSVHWGSPLSSPDATVRETGRNGLITALRDCKAYGGTSVLLVPAVVNKGISYADAYRRSQEEIRKVLPLAEELEVDIALENVWNNFLLSPLEAARYVDEFESRRIGWYFDVGNIVNYGWPEHWVETLGERIMKLDIKEYSRQKRNDEGLWKGFQVELLEGDCDWPAVMSALDRVGFTGWASAEVGGGDLDRLRDIAARMDRIFAS